MKKKFLVFSLVLLFLLGTVNQAMAKTKEPRLETVKEKIAWLQKNGYVIGDEEGKLNLNDPINRAEITKLIIHALDLESEAEKMKQEDPAFSDIEKDYWANGYINLATKGQEKKGLPPFIHGYEDKTFKPKENTRYSELSKILVALGKEDLNRDLIDQANKNWPKQWMDWAAAQGYYADIYVPEASNYISRDKALAMFYNFLYVEKGGNSDAKKTKVEIAFIGADGISETQVYEGKVGQSFKEAGIDLSSIKSKPGYRTKWSPMEPHDDTLIKDGRNYYEVEYLKDDRKEVEVEIIFTSEDGKSETEVYKAKVGQTFKEVGIDLSNATAAPGYEAVWSPEKPKEDTIIKESGNIYEVKFVRLEGING